MPDELSHLLLRGALYDEAEADPRTYLTNDVPPPPPAPEEPPPFEHLNGLLLNLKHVLATTLKSPEQIDVAAAAHR